MTNKKLVLWAVFFFFGVSEAAAFEVDYELQYLNTGDYESMFTAAIEQLSQEVKRNPANANMRFALAVLYLDKEKYPEAKQQLEEILRLQPDNADGWFYLGLLHRRSGDQKAFIEHMNRVISLNPKHVKAYNRLAVHYDVEGQFEKAEKILSEALSHVGPEESFHVNLANLHWSHLHGENGRLDAVISNLNVAVKLHPREQSFFLLGLAHRVKNDHETSREAMRKVLEINPKNINALLVIADTYKETKDFDKAMEFAKKAKAIQPSNKAVEAFLQELKEFKERA